MAQNLMSVAAVAICACAAAAAASSALMPVLPCAALPEETALRRPAATVDFSAWVAEVVRR